MGGVGADDAERPFMAGDQGGHLANHAVIDEKGDGAEPGFLWQGLDYDGLAGGQSKPALGCRVGGDDDITQALDRPTDATTEGQELAVGHQLEEAAILDFEGLRHQHDDLVEERRKISAGHGELAESADDGLLKRAVEQRFFAALALLDALLES